MKRREFVIAATTLSIAGCIDRKEGYQPNETQNGTSEIDSNQSSTLTISSVDDSPSIPEKFHSDLDRNNRTIIIENPESNQLYISQRLSLPNPSYSPRVDARVVDEDEIVVDFSSADTSDPDVAAPSVIQPTIEMVGITVSDFQPNTTVTVSPISAGKIAHETTKGTSVKKYNGR